MLRKARIAFFAFAVALSGYFILPAGMSSPGMSIIGQGVSTAQAQERKRRSLFSVLFGRNKAKRKAVRSRVKVRQRKRARKTRRARNTARNRRTAKRRNATRKSRRAATAAPAVVTKAEDAKLVLVVGDFFAKGLADGLEDLLADAPGLKVVDAGNGLSGLVRSDVVNWPERIPQLVEELKPAYIVAMVGANDRQLIKQEGTRHQKRTPQWDGLYKQRVTAFADALKGTGLPYNWVGLPPMRLKSMSQDYLVFNEWYRAAAESPSGTFVDVWDGFSDEDGNYSRSGPDVSGQIVLLRPKDGINMTKAGRKRLAFYIAADIRKAIDDPLSIQIANLKGDTDARRSAPVREVYDPAKTGRTVVINLNDPVNDGGSTLAGDVIDLSASLQPIEASARVPQLETSATQNNSTPATAPRRSSRADAFVWPPKPYAVPEQPSSVATVVK
ncbi:MAG: DUF459 domain-containing protein [Ahrensia sp.]|nr:DUF459 domain-containing protein [Ahrensia sp.]